jgi:hypothetical protein
MCISIHITELALQNIPTDTQLRPASYKLPVLDCLSDDDMPNLRITVTHNDNTALESPPDDANINSANFNRPHLFLYYSCMVKRVILTIQRSVFIETKLL